MQRFAVIFDFNGTMLFDTRIQYQAWNILAQKTLGHEIDQRTFLREANGRTSSETVDLFWGNHVTKQQKQALITRKRELYKEYCLAHPEEFHLAEGIPEILDLLEKYRVQQCCYGHLHGPVIRRRVEGQRGETAFSLISGDYLGFVPKKICD